MKTPVGLLVVMFALLSACKEPMTAVLNSGDQVTLLKASRGHELVVDKGGQKARIRLVGIYAFDPNITEKSDAQTWALNAVDWMSKLAVGKVVTVQLERAEPDPRGRFLGYVHLGEEDLGERMVREGYAALYTEYPFSREQAYTASEAPARAGALGLWAAPFAVKRITALRQTWKAARARDFGHDIADALLADAAPGPAPGAPR